jgi:hypothetical protein
MNMITWMTTVNFFGGQQPNLSLGCLIVEVSRSQIVRHTHVVEDLWASDQLVTEAANYTTHNKHKRQTSMASVGFRPSVAAIRWPHTHAWDHTTTGINCDCSLGAMMLVSYLLINVCGCNQFSKTLLLVKMSFKWHFFSVTSVYENTVCCRMYLFFTLIWLLSLSVLQ